MAYFINTPKVGRSQGASIFWGLISVCFAAAACFYYWKNHENETKATIMRDEVLNLQDERDALNSQKEKLQANISEVESQLKTREDLVQEKETQLAAEEARLEGLGKQSEVQSQQNLAQVAMVKRFNDAIRKLPPDSGTDVVERGGRPVVRIPNAQLFQPGDTLLKPEGKALLNQLSQAIVGQLDTFELRVSCYSDTDAEGYGAKHKDEAALNSPSAASWALTAERAAALARYYRDQTQMPFQNVLVVGRGDAEPILSNGGEGHARNQRVEITVTPLPVPFHAPDSDKPKVTPATSTASTDSSAGTPPPIKKAKDKKQDSTSRH